MELSRYEGELQPKSQQVVHVTLRPSKPYSNHSTIKYQLHQYQGHNTLLVLLDFSQNQ